jgi:DNA-binding transcriptional MerR regulator
MSDAERLHRILVYRELGFNLAGIARILDDPAVDAVEHLRRQRSLLEKQLERLQRMIGGVERMMNAKKTGLNLTPGEMKEMFGSFDPAEHAKEAEGRWGGTDAYAESQRRTSSYDKQQWLQIREEANQIGAGLAAAMREGVPPDGEQAMDLAEQQHIARWFYDCSFTIHTCVTRSRPTRNVPRNRRQGGRIAGEPTRARA